VKLLTEQYFLEAVCRRLIQFEFFGKLRNGNHAIGAAPPDGSQ